MRTGLRQLAVMAALALGAAGTSAQNAPGVEAAHEYETGRVAYARQDFAGARGAFERAVALAPNDPDFHYWLGRSLGMQALHASIFTRFSLARRTKAEFERALALDPRSVPAREALIIFDLRAPAIAGGSKEEALAQARVLRRLSPYRGGLELARALYATGKRQEAVAELKAVAAAYPDSARPAAELARLRR